MATSRPSRPTGDRRPARSKRAVLKDAVPCSAGDAPTTAPRGEYEIETMRSANGACCVGLCSCATRNRFTLSFDAYLQHLNEGRIALTVA